MSLDKMSTKAKRLYVLYQTILDLLVMEEMTPDQIRASVENAIQPGTNNNEETKNEDTTTDDTTDTNNS